MKKTKEKKNLLNLKVVANVSLIVVDVIPCFCHPED